MTDCNESWVFMNRTLRPSSSLTRVSSHPYSSPTKYLLPATVGIKPELSKKELLS